MQDPPWKRMVEELRQRKFESPYLARLEERLGAARARDDLAAEILREVASALGRADEKVNVALLELDVLGARIDARSAAGAPASELRALVEAFNAARLVAERALWELKVHREAVGFRREDLSRHYPIPPRR